MKKLEIDLSGPEGNVFNLLGLARSLAKQIGLDDKRIISEMTSGDYDTAVDTFEKYFADFVTLYRS